MTIDGAPARACMTFVRDGMTVEPLRAGEPLVAPPATTLEPVVLAPELLVLGGGPAGLAAAAAAAEAGVQVVLVDERAKLGGQFYKQPSDGARLDESALDRQYRDGRSLIRRVEQAGVDRLAGVQVWGADGPAELLAVGAGTVLRPPPAAARAGHGRVRARRAAAGMDASRVHDDGCGADADARLPGASRAPRARLGERPAQHPGGGGDRPRRRRGGGALRARAVPEPASHPLRCEHAGERARSGRRGHAADGRAPPREGTACWRALRSSAPKATGPSSAPWWRGSTERAARCPGARARSRSMRSSPASVSCRRTSSPGRSA